MECAVCGTTASIDAKFCANCGADLAEQRAAHEVADTAVEPTAPASEAPAARPIADIIAEPATEAPPAPVSGAMPTTEPTHVASAVPSDDASRTHERSRNEFLDAVLPIIKTPIVVLTALAVLLALVISLVASTLVQALINLVADLELPDSAGSWWDFAWTSHFTMHQVPFATDQVSYAVSGLLLVAVALASCAVAFRLAPRLLATTSIAPHEPVSAPPVSVRTRVLAFALTYAIANLILGAFGPDEIGIAFVLGLLITFAVAALGAGVSWLALRSRVAPNRAAAFMADAPTASTANSQSMLRRAWRAVSIPTATFVAMVVVASVLTLVANVVQHATQDDGRRPAITHDVTNVLDNGWTTVNYGLLGASSTDLEADDDSIFGDSDVETERSVRLWDLRDDDSSLAENSPVPNLSAGGLDIAPFLIVLIAAIGTVLLGGLYAGYRVARATDATATQQRAALAGAITGPAWALTALVMSLVVTDRWSVDTASLEGGFTMVNGVQVFFLALLFGAVLGAAGGLIAATQASRNGASVGPDASPATTVDAPSDTTAPTA